MLSGVRSRPILVAMPAVALLSMLWLGGCPVPRPVGGEEEVISGAGGQPTLEFVYPTTDVTVTAGDVVEIRWIDSDADDNADITIFYDEDGLADTGDEQIIAQVKEDPDDAGDMTQFDTTGLDAGTYYIGGTIDDGETQVTVYAAGRVIVEEAGGGGGGGGGGGAAPALVQTFRLDEIGVNFNGCVFEGFSFAGYLGEAMAGRFDIYGPGGAPDGISDFVLVAPTADSHYVERPDVGEAYLIFGWDSAANDRPDWYTGSRFNVNEVGSGPIAGAIIVGPAYAFSSNGIRSVYPFPDRDGDGGAELFFGCPRLLRAYYDDQDYDPCDNDVPYSNGPFVWPNPSTQVPQEDDLDDYGTVTSAGYVVGLSSQTALYSPGTGLGAVVHIDDIGQEDDTDREPHPRSIYPTGVRLYQVSRLSFYIDLLNNDYRFGSAIGYEDVDGNGSVELLVSAPLTADSLGRVEIFYGAFWDVTAQPSGGDCWTWPFAIPIGSPCIDRAFVWPFYDLIFGDSSLAMQGQLGKPVGIGDFNDDGLGDFAVAAPRASLGGAAPEAGIAYIVFGRAPFGDHALSEIDSPSIPDALSGIMIRGTAQEDWVGEQITALGVPNRTMPNSPTHTDFDADGLPDVVIAAPGRDAAGKPDAGAIAIVWGNVRLDGRFTWDQIGTEDLPGVVITGANQGDRFGTYLACAGDVNGDGSDDLLVAAPGAENPYTGGVDTGAVYLIFGPGPDNQDVYQGLEGTISVEDLEGLGIGYRVYYGKRPGGQIGPVAGAGDVNNDGYEDILIADPEAAPLGRTDAGEVYLIFGGPSGQ